MLTAAIFYVRDSVLLVLIPWVNRPSLHKSEPNGPAVLWKESQLHDDNGGFLSVPVIEFDGPNPVLV